MQRTLGPSHIAVFAAALALFFTLTPGSSLAGHVRCGDVITQDTRLDSDLTCTGTGLTVAAGDLTLDLGGHTIQGSGSGAGVALQWQDRLFSGVHIRAGTIRGFSYGVDVEEILDTVVNRVVLEGNQIGFSCVYAPGCSIFHSVVRHNLLSGISLHAIDVGTGRPSIIRGNRVHDNSVGLSLIDNRAIVSHNRIHDNRREGIHVGLEDFVEILHNRIEANAAEGIVVGGPANVSIVGNRIARNARDGVEAFGGGDFGDARVTVDDNRVDRNGDDGIDVDDDESSPEYSLIVANKAYFNADLGIEAGPGTVDGGGNKAKHNGNPAQCTGVRCK